MKKISLTFVSTWPVVTDGIATFCDNLANALPKNYNGVDVSWNVVEIKKFAKQNDHQQDRVVFSFDWDKGDYQAIAEKINALSSDAVVIQYINALYKNKGQGVLELISAITKPVTVVLHSIPMLSSQEDVEEKQVILKEIAKQDVDVVVMSDTAKVFVVQEIGFRPDRVHRIYHGAPEFAKLSSQEAEELRQSLGYTPDDFIVFNYGVFRPDKGVKQLIEAVSILSTSGDHKIKLLLAGTDQVDGKYLGELKGLITDPGTHTVKFIERFLSEEEIGELLQATQALVLPQSNLGLHSSGTLSYGLSAGALIISTPIFHAKEVLPGRGIIIPDNQPKTIAEVISTVRNDMSLRRKLMTASSEFGQQVRWPVLAKSYLDIFMKRTASQ